MGSKSKNWNNEMVRLLLFALLVWGAYYLVKKMIGGYREYLGTHQDQNRSVSETELIQDPQCGAYFMKQQGVKAVIDGRIVYFCSEQCHERYRQSRGAK
jgi:YHS domain-containing protein